MMAGLSPAISMVGASLLLLLGMASAQEIAVERPIIDTCTAASWKELSILPTPKNPSFFNTIRDWTASQYKQWLTSDLQPTYVPSTVFCGIALAVFVTFVAWRCIRGSCYDRSSPPDVSAQPTDKELLSAPQLMSIAPSSSQTTTRNPIAWLKQHNTNRTMMVVKAIIFVLAFTAFILTIVGMANASRGVATKTWQKVDATVTHINRIADQVKVLLAAVNESGNALTDLQRVALAGVSGTPAELAARPILRAGENFNQDVHQTTARFEGVADQMRADVIGRIDAFKQKRYDQTVSTDNTRYALTILVLVFAFLFLLVLCAAMLLNIPSLFTASLVVLQLLVVCYFLIGVLMGLSLGAANDICPAAEVVARSFVPDRWKVLADYYLYGTGGPADKALADAGVVDVTAFNAQLNSATNDVVNAINTLLQPQGDLKAAVDRTQASIQAAFDAKDQLLQLASHEAFMTVYLPGKDFVCCTVPQDFSQLWIALTVGGWIMMVMLAVSCVLLTQYDNLRASPGCSCARLGPFQPAAPALLVSPFEGHRSGALRALSSSPAFSPKGSSVHTSPVLLRSDLETGNAQVPANKHFLVQGHQNSSSSGSDSTPPQAAPRPKFPPPPLVIPSFRISPAQRNVAPAQPQQAPTGPVVVVHPVRQPAASYAPTRPHQAPVWEAPAGAHLDSYDVTSYGTVTDGVSNTAGHRQKSGTGKPSAAQTGAKTSAGFQFQPGPLAIRLGQGRAARATLPTLDAVDKPDISKPRHR